MKKLFLSIAIMACSLCSTAQKPVIVACDPLGNISVDLKKSIREDLITLIEKSEQYSVSNTQLLIRQVNTLSAHLDTTSAKTLKEIEMVNTMRNNLEKIQAAIRLDNPDIAFVLPSNADIKDIVKTGKKGKADFVLVSDISTNGTQYLISCKIVDVKNSVVLAEKSSTVEKNVSLSQTVCSLGNSMLANDFVKLSADENKKQLEDIKTKKENAQRELFLKDSLLYESYNTKLDSLKNTLNNSLLSQYFNTSQRTVYFSSEKLEKTKNYKKTYEKAAEICKQKIILFSDTLTYEFYNNKFDSLKTALNNDFLNKQFNILQQKFTFPVEKLKYTKKHQKEYEKTEKEHIKKTTAFSETVRKNLYKADFSKTNVYSKKIAEYKNTPKYGATISAVFDNNDKIKNEYNKNKKYFSSQVEFYEAYSSGNYKAILKVKKKAKE